MRAAQGNWRRRLLIERAMFVLYATLFCTKDFGPPWQRIFSAHRRSALKSLEIRAIALQELEKKEMEVFDFTT